MRTWLAGWCVVAGACSPGGKPVGDDDDDAHTTTGCTNDDGCSPLAEICDAGTCVPGDRDDAFEDATPLFVGDDQAKPGVIATPGDIDTFAYESPGQEWVSVRTVVEGEDPFLDTVLTLHRSNGSVHAQIDNFPVWPYRVTGYDSVLYAWLPTPGTWYVSVQDVSTFYDLEPAYGPEYAYSVLIRESSGTGEVDSVTDPSGTLDVPNGDTILSIGVVLDAPGDVDHLTLVTPGDELLEIWGQPGLTGSDATPLVRLWDGTERLGTKIGLGEDGYLSWFEAHAGTYRLEATDADGGGGPDHWFPLFARTYDPGDAHPFFSDNAYTREVEPNDGTPGPTLAAEVDATTGGGEYSSFRLQGRLDQVPDSDPWQVTVPGGALLSVRCWTSRFGSDATIAVSLLDGGAPFATSDTADADDYYVVEATAPPSGAVELRIDGVGAVSGPSTWYRCALYAE